MTLPASDAREEARRHVREMVARHGQQVVDDPRKVEGLLRDLCCNERPEANMLIAALKEGVPAELVSSSDTGAPPNLTLGRMFTRLRENMGMADEAAAWAVETWALALGVISTPILRQRAAASQPAPSTALPRTAPGFAGAVQSGGAPPPAFVGTVAAAVAHPMAADASGAGREWAELIIWMGPELCPGRVAVTLDGRTIATKPFHEGLDMTVRVYFGTHELCVDAGGTARSYSIVVDSRCLYKACVAYSWRPPFGVVFSAQLELLKLPAPAVATTLVQGAGTGPPGPATALPGLPITPQVQRPDPPARPAPSGPAPPNSAAFRRICVNPKDGAEMVYVAAGEFLMGGNDPEKWMAASRPQHEVYLDAFWIYRNDVTVAQYREFCAATGCKMARAPAGGWKGRDNHPVVNVSWDDATVYSVWAGVALPTEAQWEKAARGTDGRRYPWGNDWDDARANSLRKFHFGSNLYSALRFAWYVAKVLWRTETRPVGSYPAGASPYGCLDMAGNVLQWCADWYDEGYYPRAPGQNPTGPGSGTERVQRGGSWSHLLGNCRSAARHSNYPARGGTMVGFRCVGPEGSG